MFTKESKGVLAGEYGALPGEVNEEVRKKAIGDAKPITCRPADLIKPELENYKKELGSLAKSEEDVLSYALFPESARKFFEAREKPKKEAVKPDSNEPRKLYVEDLTIS